MISQSPHAIVIIVLTGTTDTPTLYATKFKCQQQDTFFGLTVMATVLLSGHELDNAINLGSNAWSFEPEISVS